MNQEAERDTAKTDLELRQALAALELMLPRGIVIQLANHLTAAARARVQGGLDVRFNATVGEFMNADFMTRDHWPPPKEAKNAGALSDSKEATRAASR